MCGLKEIRPFCPTKSSSLEPSFATLSLYEESYILRAAMSACTSASVGGEQTSTTSRLPRPVEAAPERPWRTFPMVRLAEPTACEKDFQRGKFAALMLKRVPELPRILLMPAHSLNVPEPALDPLRTTSPEESEFRGDASEELQLKDTVRVDAVTPVTMIAAVVFSGLASLRVAYTSQRMFSAEFQIPGDHEAAVNTIVPVVPENE